MKPGLRALLAELMKNRPTTEALKAAARPLGLLDGIEDINNRPGLVDALTPRVLAALDELTQLEEPPAALVPETTPDATPTEPESDTAPPAAGRVSSQPPAAPPPVTPAPVTPAPRGPGVAGTTAEVRTEPVTPSQPPAAPPPVTQPDPNFTPEIVTGVAEADALIVVDGRYLLAAVEEGNMVLWSIQTARAPRAAKGLPVAFWADTPEARAQLVDWKDRPEGVGSARSKTPKIPAGVAVAPSSPDGSNLKSVFSVPPTPPALRRRKKNRRRPAEHPANSLHVEVQNTGAGFVATCRGVNDEDGNPVKFWGSTPAEAKTKAQAAGLRRE